MQPLIATAALARRIDRVELALMLGVADAARAAGGSDVHAWPVGGAAAVFVERGSPCNKVLGLGLGGAPQEADLAAIERAYAARGARVQVEFATLGDAGVAALLCARGYRLTGFENVLARRLAAVPGRASTAVTVAPVGEADAGVWLDAVTSAFLSPDAFDGPAAHESFDRAVLERTLTLMSAVPGTLRLLARLEGRAAGGASLFVHDGIAVLCGAATLPACRRRGVQSALLAARLALAHERGCELAVVTTQPGSKSQENVQRAGFELVYSRAVLVREP